MSCDLPRANTYADMPCSCCNTVIVYYIRIGMETAFSPFDHMMSQKLRLRLLSRLSLTRGTAGQGLQLPVIKNRNFSSNLPPKFHEIYMNVF